MVEQWPGASELAAVEADIMELTQAAKVKAIRARMPLPVAVETAGDNLTLCCTDSVVAGTTPERADRCSVPRRDSRVRSGDCSRRVLSRRVLSH
ncbi:hypothetical protein IQ62_34865 [Streptomyces scabiei]|uniref:hypothetical protein n=1 Tax=Streptomyces scabiei TaxID=1930 RepID=UPI0004E64E94|nr:hypothetical protein [Streptomyces scabiei]KFF96693.1 hypothetical protein IQ62_34865 [Streptomyces scabiei]